MPYVLVRLKVKEYGKWKAVFDAHSDARKAASSTKGQIFRDANDPNMVTVLGRYESSAKLDAFLQSDTLKEAMQKAGAMGPPEIHIFGQVEDYAD